MKNLSCGARAKETLRQNVPYCEICGTDTYDDYSSIAFDLGKYGFMDVVSHFLGFIANCNFLKTFDAHLLFTVTKLF